MTLWLIVGLLAQCALAADPVLVPQIEEPWWPVAGQPDLGKYSSDTQQPGAFTIWQAADGTWQLQSAIRYTSYPGKTRLFYHWKGAKLTDPDWRPMGIAMTSDPGFGETEGGLQAPHVIRVQHEYLMFYGDWEHICLAKGVDGKTFARQLMPDGKCAMFSEGARANAPDPMALKIGDLFYLYYTAYPDKLGADFVRTSKDLRQWSSSKKVAAGGTSGSGAYSAECPFVYYHQGSGFYYLFRTQKYDEKGHPAQTNIYRSKDPTDFGVDTDRYLVGTIPHAGQEIIEYEGQTYIAVFRPKMQGIQIAKLRWVPKP